MSWTMTLGATLVIIASVVTPLGLRDEILGPPYYGDRHGSRQGDNV